MIVLVDTSIWVDYFRAARHSSSLDALIDENLAATNKLILTEMIPFLAVRRHKDIIALLDLLPVLPLNIDWDGIATTQTRCLQKGINGIGIPDLIIVQNTLQHHAILYTLDNHFKRLQTVAPLKLYGTS
jgi:predicted nucleic acid-binding protein